MSFLPGLTSLPSKIGGAIGGALSNPLVDAGLLGAGAYFAAPFLGIGGSSAAGAAGAAAGGAGALPGATAAGSLTGLGSILGPALGGLVAGVGSYAGSAQTNAEAMQMQQQAEAYNTQMSNTAYQRGVASMEAAGLSPMLAYGQGGASTPTIAAAPVQNKLGGAVSAAVSSAGAIQSMQQQAAATDLITDQAGLARASAENQAAQAYIGAERMRTEQVNADRAQWEQDNIWPLDLQKARADAAGASAVAKAKQLAIPGAVNESNFQTSVQTMPQWIKILEGILSSAGSAKSLLK